MPKVRRLKWELVLTPRVDDGERCDWCIDIQMSDEASDDDHCPLWTSLPNDQILPLCRELKFELILTT